MPVEADARASPFEGDRRLQFRIVSNANAPDKRAALAKVTRILKPGGGIKQALTTV